MLRRVGKNIVANYRNASRSSRSRFVDIEKIRNIGIIAHIDAGKTTTTERMLYYAGYSHCMGEVHHGDTVMDYMIQERERGITITSAAISFNWGNHKINLIDTPGHVDFTIEVERSLRVLDGAVLILDASAGVEVQTLKVCDQADKYEIPRIVYINKMDKYQADVNMCIESIKKKLKLIPVQLHIPLGEAKQFRGVIDLVSMEKVEWNLSERKDGLSFVRNELCPQDELWEFTALKREMLIDEVADQDDTLAEKIVRDETTSNVTSDDLHAALRRLVLQRRLVPLICGSSYHNTGVQLLMDAIVRYLPNPIDKQQEFVQFYGDSVCALAFKVQHSKRLGQLTFLRLYSGCLKPEQKLYNVSRNCSEKIDKVMIALADDLHEVESIQKGNIAVVTGLKHVVTGDALASSELAANNAMKGYAKFKGLNHNDDFSGLGGINVPDPVFFCTIEPPSVGYQKQLDYALKCLQLEDPTFKVEESESGQTVISGMGELHLDIIKDRILKEYKVDAFLGPLQISYRETVSNPYRATVVFDKSLGNNRHFVKITISVSPSTETSRKRKVKVIVTKENELGKLRLDYLKAIENGVKQALNHGPLLGFQVMDVAVELHWLEVGPRTSYPMLSAATADCVSSALKKGVVQLMEPIMKMEIVTNENYVGAILSDLAKRRSQILEVQARQDARIVLARTPLSELISYTTEMRTLTSGNVSLSMQFDCYQKMTTEEQNQAICKVTGFVPL